MIGAVVVVVVVVWRFLAVLLLFLSCHSGIIDALLLWVLLVALFFVPFPAAATAVLLVCALDPLLLFVRSLPLRRGTNARPWVVSVVLPSSSAIMVALSLLIINSWRKSEDCEKLHADDRSIDRSIDRLRWCRLEAYPFGRFGLGKSQKRSTDSLWETSCRRSIDRSFAVYVLSVLVLRSTVLGGLDWGGPTKKRSTDNSRTQSVRVITKHQDTKTSRD